MFLLNAVSRLVCRRPPGEEEQRSVDGVCRMANQTHVVQHQVEHTGQIERAEGGECGERERQAAQR